MEYRYKPLYKYISLGICLFLFIFHQKPLIKKVNILLIAFIITVFSVIMDYIFIKNNPSLLIDIEKEKKKKIKRKKNILQKKYIDNLVDTISEDTDDSSSGSEYESRSRSRSRSR